MRTHSRLGLVLAPLAALALAAPARAQVYSQNFESGVLGPEWSGAGTIQSTEGLSAFGFGANHLRNDTGVPSVLTLAGLAPHTSMTLLFDLAMWDSIDNGDVFQLIVDGTVLYGAGNAFGNYFTPSGECEGPGIRITDPFSAFAVPNYGYNPGFRDCGRTASFTFAHSAAGATISFAYPGTQGGLDESFGIDNVVVRTDAAVGVVPEPGTYALLATGLAGLALARRRRQG